MTILTVCVKMAKNAFTTVVKGKKVTERIAVNGYSISQLRDVTCHMGSHSVTCHPTQVNAPRLNPSQEAGTRFTYPGGMEGWVDLVVSVRDDILPVRLESRVSAGWILCRPAPGSRRPVWEYHTWWRYFVPYWHCHQSPFVPLYRTADTCELRLVPVPHNN